jgi:hypothetical protein
MTKEKKGSTITNQVTPKEVEDKVAEIDKEIPENLQEVMDKEKDGGEIVVEDEPEDKDPETEPINTPSQEELDITPEATPEPEKNPLPPIEDRYKESGQEAMILNNRNEKIVDTIEEAEKITEADITVEELKNYALALGENYDNLDSFSQNLLKKSLLQDKRFGKITTIVSDQKNIKAWVNKITDFISDDKITEQYPALKGHEDDFLKYASKKTHMSADPELLIAGFLFRLPKEEKPGDILLGRGSGTKNMPIKPAELTQEDARILRKKDPRKYMEMVQQGKFKIDLS